MAMVTNAELGPRLVEGPGRLPLDEDAVRATYDRFELHVPARSGPSPCASRPGASPTLRRPALDAPPPARPRAAAQLVPARARVRAGDLVLRRLVA